MIQEKDAPSRRTVLAGAAAGAMSAALGGAARGQGAGDQGAGAPPNVLFIMADDLGYADLSAYGRREYETRALDRLAAEGVRLTDCYANSPVCSPTRTALITGRYQYRLRVGLDEPLGPNPIGLPPEAPTMPRSFRELGYRTTLVGKWHLGAPPEFGPLRSGYDRFFGIIGGGVDYFTHSVQVGPDAQSELYDDEVPVERIGYLTDLLADRTIAEIEAATAAREPFFISLHFTAPHWPWEGPEDAAVAETLSGIQHFDGGNSEVFAAMVLNMDANIGRVLAALESAGAADNTIVVFTSDNGGERFSDVWPFSGMKAELLEGGIRVPGIVRAPGRVPAGLESAQPIMSMDWAPTLLAWAGGGGGQDYDGLDLTGPLSGGAVQERAMYWRYRANDQRALREGRWKYLRMREREYLFDIVTDQRERANLSGRDPDRFERMKAQWEAWDATMPPYPDDAPSYSNTGQLADRY